MGAFPQFITSGLCYLYLDLGQKGLQNSLGAYSVNSYTWPLSRVRVGHTVASFGAFLVTRSRQSCDHVIFVLLKAHGRVSHAAASLLLCAWHASASPMRSRGCQFLQKLRFVLSFHFCMFSFHLLSQSCLRRSETTQHTNHDIEWN